MQTPDLGRTSLGDFSSSDISINKILPSSFFGIYKHPSAPFPPLSHSPPHILLRQDVYKLHFPESLGAKVLDILQVLPCGSCMEVWEDRDQLSAVRHELWLDNHIPMVPFLILIGGEWPESSNFYLLIAAAEECSESQNPSSSSLTSTALLLGIPRAGPVPCTEPGPTHTCSETPASGSGNDMLSPSHKPSFTNHFKRILNLFQCPLCIKDW